MRWFLSTTSLYSPLRSLRRKSGRAHRLRGPARPAVRTPVATRGLAIVRPRVAAPKRQCAGRALGRPVKGPFRIVPERPARERNPAPLAATRSLSLANEIIFSRHDLAREKSESGVIRWPYQALPRTLRSTQRASTTAPQSSALRGGSVLPFRNSCADIWGSLAEGSISSAVRACGVRRHSAGSASAYPISSIFCLASTAGKSAVHGPVLGYPVLSVTA